MPLNTLKKEERRSNEVEEEEEDVERGRAVRIRGRGESVVRSSNRPTIKILTESEVSDTVTEAPRDVVEASTVVNYEKQQLAELLESKEVGPGLVLVNYRPAMIKRRKVGRKLKKKAGVRKRVRVLARQKQTTNGSKVSSTTPTPTGATTHKAPTSTTSPPQFREMRFPVRPLPSPAGSPLGSQSSPLTPSRSIFGSPNLPTPFKFSSFDDFAEFDAQFGGAVPPSTAASPTTTLAPTPAQRTSVQELPRRALFGHRAQPVAFEPSNNLPLVKESPQQLFPSRQRNIFSAQPESPRSSFPRPRIARPMNQDAFQQQQKSSPSSRSRGLPRRILFGARSPSPSPPHPQQASSSSPTLPSPTSSLPASTFGPTFPQQAPSLPKSFFPAPSNSLTDQPLFVAPEPPSSPPTNPTSNFILHPASTTNQQPTTSFINIRTGSYTINTSL